MDRTTLIAELLEEFAAFSPTGMMRAMHRWPGGRLSLVHLNVLMQLDAEGAVPMRAIADALDVSQASATGIVDRMEQRGLAVRQRDVDDRRVVRVVATEEGRELIAGMAAQRREHLAQMLGELTTDELEAFLVGIRAMRRARERFKASHHAGHPGHATPDAGPPSTVTPDPETSR